MSILAKVAVIVGAGPGVGISVATRFAKEGYKIALISRNKEKLEAFQKQIHTDSHVFSADAGNEASLKAALDEVKKTMGVPEVVVYNAAFLGERGRLDSVSVSHFEAAFRLNVVGALITAQHFLPEYKAAKKGTILLTGGGLAFGPISGFDAGELAIGKAGVRSLTQSLFNELKPHGIHVGSVVICGLVAPGTAYDPTKIANEYWNLHSQSPDAWTNEIVFK